VFEAYALLVNRAREGRSSALAMLEDLESDSRDAPMVRQANHEAFLRAPLVHLEEAS
jgi:hypothetical protein